MSMERNICGRTGDICGANGRGCFTIGKANLQWVLVGWISSVAAKASVRRSNMLSEPVSAQAIGCCFCIFFLFRTSRFGEVIEVCFWECLPLTLTIKVFSNLFLSRLTLLMLRPARQPLPTGFSWGGLLWSMAADDTVVVLIELRVISCAKMSKNLCIGNWSHPKHYITHLGDVAIWHCVDLANFQIWSACKIAVCTIVSRNFSIFTSALFALFAGVTMGVTMLKISAMTRTPAPSNVLLGGKAAHSVGVKKVKPTVQMGQWLRYTDCLPSWLLWFDTFDTWDED